MYKLALMTGCEIQGHKNNIYFKEKKNFKGTLIFFLKQLLNN